MIRVCLFTGDRAFGYDVTGWEDIRSEDYYDNFLDEDLFERVNQGDIVMYFDTNESAEHWCEEHGFEYKLFVREDDNE